MSFCSSGVHQITNYKGFWMVFEWFLNGKMTFVAGKSFDLSSNTFTNWNEVGIAWSRLQYRRQEYKKFMGIGIIENLAMHIPSKPTAANSNLELLLFLNRIQKNPFHETAGSLPSWWSYGSRPVRKGLDPCCVSGPAPGRAIWISPWGSSRWGSNISAPCHHVPRLN